MKILARITHLNMLEASVHISSETFMMMSLMGRNIINNPKAMRITDIATGDIIFYEETP